MPRGSPTSRKNLASKSPAKSLLKMQAVALDMEDLLSEIENLVQALRFIGHGMESRLRRRKLPNLRSRLHGGPAAGRFEGGLDPNDQGIGAFVA